MTTLADCPIVELVRVPAPAPNPSVRPLREISFRANAWLPDELDRLQQLFAADTPLRDIAQLLDRPLHGVQSRLHELGLRRNSTQPWTGLDDAELARRYGLDPTAAIAADLGRSCPAIYARAALLGLTEGNPPPWTPWEDAQLAEAYRRALPIARIAALIGRPPSGTAARASALGLRHPNQPADWSAQELKRALELAEAGILYRGIAIQLTRDGFPARSAIAVRAKLRALGYSRGWGRPWEPEEDALLEAAYAAGASLTPLTTRLARTRASIRWRAGFLGLRGTHSRRNGFRNGPDWSEADLAFLRAHYGKMPTPRLATALGRTKAAVLTRANVLGLEHGYISAWTNGDHDALEIAHRHGIAIADLAAALGRKRCSVSKYATNHGFAFGRRPLLPQPPTRNDILKLGTKGEGEGGKRHTSMEASDVHPDQAHRQPRDDHQGHEALLGIPDGHPERTVAELAASQGELRTGRLRHRRRCHASRRLRQRLRHRGSRTTPRSR